MRARLASVVLATLAVTGLVGSLEARQAGAPLAPTLFPATVVDATVTLQWTANAAGAAATSYQIHAGSGPGLSNLVIHAVAANPTVFTAVAPPGTYYVRLVALNGPAASVPSNEIVVTVGGVGPCLPPGAPTGLTAAVAGTLVTLNWNAPSTGGAPSGFVLVVGLTPGASNVSFSLGPQTTLMSPAPTGQFYVRVVATNACGNSPPSNEVSVLVGPGGGGALILPAGVYQGTMANHNRAGRPPITGFTLTLNQQVPSSGLQMISGRWQDNRGCVKTNGIFGGTPTAAGPQVSIESLTCNDGDLGLRVTAINGNVYTGVCLSGGPNCTFAMTRQ